MTHWHSLYLWSKQQQDPVEAIQTYLEAQSYTEYNPFGPYPGMAYPMTLKTFVSPVENACIRVLVEGEGLDSLAAHLSQAGDCLAMALDGNLAMIHFFRDGKLIDLQSGLETHCKPDAEGQLATVLAANFHDLPALQSGQIGDVPLDALPDDMQAMAKQVNTKQANTLFKKIKKQFIKAVGQYDATVFLQSESDWDSQGGQYIRALMACLTVPQHWREPDFSTLRRAFALQSRRRYAANTVIFPGDEEALAAVPNAQDYIPVYGGKQV